ncbi:MAG: dienelactone hydrolase family protein [Gammaproteobacteria bacterium]|jgi:carboxymethylenebutenolidase|nr:dienelactone hydrolase family protein [Gammaproteobacteria bacterium]
MSDRRRFLKGLTSLPLATVLASPRLAAAVSAGLQEVEAKLSDGRTVKAALATPQGQTKGSILLIHEWWGLNNQIKSVASEFADQGYKALAVDLYRGHVADTRADARALMKAVDPMAATETLNVWVKWLREDARAGDKIATIGWCFGGGWSLNASLSSPVDATIVYYGRVNKTADELGTLKGPVLGHYATQDQWINKEMVSGFESAMDAAGKTYTSHWYDAQHAFANPTSARYDGEDAALAWRRTLDFLKQQLG